MKKKIVSSIIVLILLASSICLPIYAVSTSDLNDQKKDLDGKISEAKDDQKQIKELLNAQMKEISSLDASISQKESEIGELEREISSLQNSISEKQKELEQKQKEYDENQKLMETRLVAMYETGETSMLDILFDSGNIIEFISNYYLIAQINECDQELLDSIEKDQEEITKTKNTLEEQKAKVDSAKKEKEAKANLLKSEKVQDKQKQMHFQKKTKNYKAK